MLIYLHGFNSSPDSFKANLLRHHLETLGRGGEFLCPKLPWQFSRAAALIDSVLCSSKKSPVALVGSSLGGYYATYFAEKYDLPAVLINPAVYPYLSLGNYLGAQANLYTGETYMLRAEHIEELKALEVKRIARPERYLLLTRTGDEVLDYREAVEKFAGCAQLVIEGGNHTFHDFAQYVERVVAFTDAQGVPPRTQRGTDEATTRRTI
jgi:predicted esterase YcpF (UPF0227 family)